MNQFTANGESIIAVEMKGKFNHYFLTNMQAPDIDLLGQVSIEDSNDKEYIASLPPVKDNDPHHYEILFPLSSATEEDAAKLVELHSITRFNEFGYKNYEKSYPHTETKPGMIDYTCQTALESLYSKLRSEGIVCKAMEEEPKIYEFESSDKGYQEWEYALKDYNALPDDLLLIRIKPN